MTVMTRNLARKIADAREAITARLERREMMKRMEQMKGAKKGRNSRELLQAVAIPARDDNSLEEM